MNDTNPKKQLIDKLRKVSNILVTVSRNPDVDQLAAALALTLILDKIKKHATAVFSGQIPPVMNFLEPEKTFENNADSLRDFIISLDKNKADRLRMKTDGGIVKILVTPYRTKITPNDISFSEGEFNVELVMAIGVDNKTDLDAVLTAHGRIFHDATIATVNLNAGQDLLGSISWCDTSANSYCEMITTLVNELSAEESLIDGQISTALLTGIVATTDQFRNEQTTPAIMKLAAELMTSGANQQLIASELSAANNAVDTKTESTEVSSPDDDEFTVLNIDKSLPEEPVTEIAEIVEPEEPESSVSETEPTLAPEQLPETPEILPSALPALPDENPVEAQIVTPEKPLDIPLTDPVVSSDNLVTEEPIITEQVSGITPPIEQPQPVEPESVHTSLNVEPPVADDSADKLNDLIASSNATSSNTAVGATTTNIPASPVDNLSSFADNPTLKFTDPTASPTTEFPPVIPGSLPVMPVGDDIYPSAPTPSTIPPSLNIPLPPPPPLPPIPDINALPPIEPLSVSPSPDALPDTSPVIPPLGVPPAEPEVFEDKVPDIMEFQIPTQ